MATHERTSEVGGQAEKKQEDEEKATAKDKIKSLEINIQKMRKNQKTPAATGVVYGKSQCIDSTIAGPSSEQAATPRSDLIQVVVEAASSTRTVKAAVMEYPTVFAEEKKDIVFAPATVTDEKATGGNAEKKPKYENRRQLTKEAVERLQNPFRPLDFVEVADVPSLSMCSSRICDDELIGDLLERYMFQGMTHFASDC
ncbi:unnamed protein product [Polarella glacialis]|uniref:Uncharacterized protein n=1 Tax=Polarella glacialis TaxID=89957 RepID=A0A813I597_POLGL|nr:unnamed protein product [Polarella glacialis]